MSTTIKMSIAVIVMVVVSVIAAFGLYWTDYWYECQNCGQTVVWKEGAYKVTGFMDNQRRVKEHKGTDDPICVMHDDNYRYLIYQDGSCERIHVL